MTIKRSELNAIYAWYTVIVAIEIIASVTVGYMITNYILL